MTSAPKSARIPPANGPARLSPTSTTLTPDKGMCSSMALALATHGVELVIGAHVGKVGHAVGERKKGRDPANVPNIVVTKPEFPQRDAVRVLKLLRLQGHLEGEIQHRALAWGNVGLAIIHGHLVSNERILGIDAQDRAMRDHTVMTVIGAPGLKDNAFHFLFCKDAFLLGFTGHFTLQTEKLFRFELCLVGLHHLAKQLTLVHVLPCRQLLVLLGKFWYHGKPDNLCPASHAVFSKLFNNEPSSLSHSEFFLKRTNVEFLRPGTAVLMSEMPVAFGDC